MGKVTHTPASRSAGWVLVKMSVALAGGVGAVGETPRVKMGEELAVRRLTVAEKPPRASRLMPKPPAPPAATVWTEGVTFNVRPTPCTSTAPRSGAARGL